MWTAGANCAPSQATLARLEGVAVSADGRLAVSASDDKTLKVWDVDSGRELRTLKGHSAEVQGVAMTADGRLAVSGSRDNTLKVWDLNKGSELSSVSTRHGHMLLRLWILASRRVPRTFKGHSGGV